MDLKKYIRFLLVAGILIMFYFLGIRLELIIILGIFMILVLLFRTKLYNNIEKTTIKNFKFISKFPNWAVKVIIVIIFIVIYFLIKLAVFEILKIFGIDIPKMMIDGINQSLEP